MSTFTDEAEVIFRSRLSDMIGSEDLSLEAVLSLIREFTANSTCRSSRKLRLFLRHVLYLLESGDEIYADCALHHHEVGAIMVIHRVAQERGEGVMRTTLKLAGRPMSTQVPVSAADVFAEYSGGNVEMAVHRGAVTIRQVVGLPARVAPLQADEIEAFYDNRRTVQMIAKSTAGHSAWRLTKIADADNDEAAIIEACAKAFEIDATDRGEIQRGRALHGVSRESHPCIGPALHVLPRQIETSGSMSVLQSLAADMPNIANAGFDAVLLGVVDPQSTEIFHAEQDDGAICPYANNHGYWSSGRCGIDPVLGEESDYVALAEVASRCGVMLIQDSVFATLGYPPQLPRLASPNSECTSLMLFLGNEAAPIYEDGLFLRELESCEAIPVASSYFLKEYAKSVARMHLGEYYQLPRPNIFCANVLRRVLQRACWQVRKAGVSAFRIDMAKHVGLYPLRRIVTALREEVGVYGLTDAVIIMEYWSTDYRDLRFALASMEPAIFRIYLYDFPLARTLRRIFLEGGDWFKLLSEVIAQRNLWKVSALCLVPVFIDHDPSFRPIYNGDTMTRDIVVAGLVLAVAMSANGPSVYSAYDDRSAAPTEFGCYAEHSEIYARRPVQSPLTYDPDGPGIAFKGLLDVVEQHHVLSDWDGTELLIAGNKDRVSISRILGAGVKSRRAIFCLSREGDASAMAEQCELLFASGSGPSVALFIKA